MVTNALVLAAALILLGVSWTILVNVSGDHRKYRLGATLLPAWCVTMVVIYALRTLDDGLKLPYGFVRGNIALGLCLVSWALLDVSRLARTYGTTTLSRAVDVAKGLMLGREASDVMASAIVRHAPIAIWLKGEGGVMLTINRRYEDQYGKPAQGYAGETDESMWGDEIGKRFGGNDLIVIETERVHHFFELAPTTNEPERVGSFVKFPVYDRHGKMIGVGGIEVTP